jgi:hypothetical protein
VAPWWNSRVSFTVVTDALLLVKLDPSQYLTTTEFQSAKPGLMSESDAIKKFPGWGVGQGADKSGD